MLHRRAPLQRTAPIATIGVRLSWLREGDSSGPLIGGEVDLNIEKLVFRLGLSSFVGVRLLPARDDLVFLEMLAAGVQAPWRYAPYLVARGGVGALVEQRAGEDATRFLGGVAGNAGLFGTIRGVLGLARALQTPGDLLTGDEIGLATRNHTPGLGQARGLGWQLASSPGCSAGPALSTGAFGHTGFTGTSLWIDPERRLAIALLANRVHPGHRPTDLHPLRRRFHQLVVQASS